MLLHITEEEKGILFEVSAPNYSSPLNADSSGARAGEYHMGDDEMHGEKKRRREGDIPSNSHVAGNQSTQTQVHFLLVGPSTQAY